MSQNGYLMLSKMPKNLCKGGEDMKAKNILLLSLLCFSMVSCDAFNNSTPYVKGDEIRVTFHLNGGNLIVNGEPITSDISLKIDEDYFFNNSYIPLKDEMQFANWYLDSKLTKPLDLSSYVVNGDIDLYAKWVDAYYTYQINDNGDACIGLNKNGIAQTNISIPTYIDGYKVTGIMDYGFSYSEAKKLYVPYFVETIGFSSFYESKLEYIELGNNITDIAHGAFIGTNNIKELKIEKNNKYLVHNMTLFEKLDNENTCEIHSLFGASDVDITRKYYSNNIKIVSIAPYCFYGRKNVHSIQLPYGIARIGDYAFANSGLMKFYMNDELIEIGDYAFADSYLNEALIYGPLSIIGDYAFKNTMITSINIPATITSIGRGALQAGVLNEIKVRTNKKYFLDDGNILEKLDDGTYALVYFDFNRNESEYHLPHKITKINSGAFYSLDNINTIYFTNVKEVEEYAFLSLSPDNSIVFTSVATSIDLRAFYEESRNMCFIFNAITYENSEWANYFLDLQDYVVLSYIEIEE